MSDKILNFAAISGFRKLHASEKIVFCGGCFDIFHYGHLQFLLNAKRQGDILVVQIESDDFISARKKRTPVHNQMQRAEIIAALACVDYVLPIPHFETDAEYGAVIQSLRPEVIAVTEGDPALSKKQQHADANGAVVAEVCPPFVSFSSSQIGAYEGIFGN